MKIFLLLSLFLCASISSIAHAQKNLVYVNPIHYNHMVEHSFDHHDISETSLHAKLIKYGNGINNFSVLMNKNKASFVMDVSIANFNLSTSSYSDQNLSHKHQYFGEAFVITKLYNQKSNQLVATLTSNIQLNSNNMDLHVNKADFIDYFSSYIFINVVKNLNYALKPILISKIINPQHIQIAFNQKLPMKPNAVYNVYAKGGKLVDDDQKTPMGFSYYQVASVKIVSVKGRHAIAKIVHLSHPLKLGYTLHEKIN